MTENQQKPLAQRLRREVRPIFEGLEENVKLMYTAQQCTMCGAHLTIRQLNRIISEGVPAICLKHYKEMHGQMNNLEHLFGQLRLF